MRRNKTVALILIIFSVVKVVLAAPAGVRQGHLGVDEGVTAASVKRGKNLISSEASTSGEPSQVPPPEIIPEDSDAESYWSSSVSSTSSAGEPLYLHGGPGGPEDEEGLPSSRPSTGEPPHLPQSRPGESVSETPNTADRSLKLKQELKAVSAMGAIIGISAGVIYGVKAIKDSSSKRYASPLLRTSPADN